MHDGSVYIARIHHSGIRTKQFLLNLRQLVLLNSNGYQFLGAHHVRGHCRVWVKKKRDKDSTGSDTVVPGHFTVHPPSVPGPRPRGGQGAPIKGTWHKSCLGDERFGMQGAYPNLLPGAAPPRDDPAEAMMARTCGDFRALYDPCRRASTLSSR